MKFGRLIEGAPKPERNIRNPENFASERSKWEIETAVFKL
jgi:hypothetical protein